MDRKKPNAIALFVLAGLIVICFFALLILHSFKAVPAGNEPTLQLSIGALIGAFSTVVGYFFGSSAGSANKTDILAKQSDEPGK